MAAAAVLAAEQRGRLGETYNIVDDEPLPRRGYYERLAEILNAPQPVFAKVDEPRANNRRISNAKAKKELGWQPRYASAREGLAAAVVREAI
jgi:nucleoside-diphosphate-sugar epimerase